MRAAVAVVASVCLISGASGCSLVSGGPTRSTRIADMGLIAASFATPQLMCHEATFSTGDLVGDCEPNTAMIVGPALLSLMVVAGMVGNGQATDGVPPPPALTLATAEPLPGLPTDETTLRLAKQMRTAAIAGQCGAVELTMPKIAARDARYHAELAKADFVARCR